MKSLSSVRPFTTPWTAAYQAPPSSYFILIHFVLLLLYRSRVKSHRKFSIGIKICDATHTQMWKVYCLCDVAFWAEQGLRSKGRRLLGCLFKLGAGAGVRWGTAWRSIKGPWALRPQLSNSGPVTSGSRAPSPRRQRGPSRTPAGCGAPPAQG